LRGILGIVFLTLLTIYFLTTLVLKVPILQVKGYNVYGITEKELPLIREKIHALGRSFPFLSEEKLLKEFNEVAENRFREVRVRKHFSEDGIRVDIEFVRREAVATVSYGRKKYLIDNEGELFEDETQKPERVIKTYSLSLVKDRWQLLKEVIAVGEEVHVKRSYVKVIRGKRAYILPPLTLLEEKDLRVLRYAVEKRFEGKEIDLRYKSFILLR